MLPAIIVFGSVIAIGLFVFILRVILFKRDPDRTPSDQNEYFKQKYLRTYHQKDSEQKDKKK